MNTKEHGICHLSLAPIREEANDKSQMVTQLLFGELVHIRDSKDPWIKVELVKDGYVGWMDHKQIIQIGPSEYSKLLDAPKVYTNEIATPIQNEDSGEVQVITIGSSIYNFDDNGSFAHLDQKFSIHGGTRNLSSKEDHIVEDAFLFLNCPYLWGGKSPFGIDCSGFTQLVYQMNGIDIPRDAWQQAELGQALSFIEEAEPGDLAFFDNDEGKITHVGIMLKDNKIIHASGKVRVDRIDHQGIFREDINDYSHSLRIIKKISQR